MSENHPAVAGLENVDIQRILPHRYPILLVDRVIELLPKRKIVAIKNVSANEPFFQGHFPGLPVMPGVLILEAMAQVGAILLLTEYKDPSEKLVLFSGIEKGRFRKPVIPGDQLRIEVTPVAWRSNAAKMQGYAYVGDKVAAEAVISCALAPRNLGNNPASKSDATPSPS